MSALKIEFKALMERENRGSIELAEVQRGFFVSFAFSNDAVQECVAFHKQSGRIIKLLSVQEILDEEHLQKMAKKTGQL